MLGHACTKIDRLLEIWNSITKVLLQTLLLSCPFQVSALISLLASLLSSLLPTPNSPPPPPASPPPPLMLPFLLRGSVRFFSAWAWGLQPVLGLCLPILLNMDFLLGGFLFPALQVYFCWSVLSVSSSVTLFSLCRSQGPSVGVGVGLLPLLCSPPCALSQRFLGIGL